MTTPVLIVGAGPAGLVTAITLARYGVPVEVIEQRQDLSGLPRATAVALRTVELLRSWGLEPGLRAVAMRVEPAGLLTPSLAAPGGMELSLGYPNAEQAAAVSPTYPAIAAQDDVEPILLEHLATYPHARVRFGTELTGSSQDADGVTAELSDGTTIRARYLVGADGAHSVVRERLGIAMTGTEDPTTHTTLLFRAPLWEVVGERRFGLYALTDPRTPAVLVPSGRGDRWLYGRECQPDETPGDIDSLIEEIRIAAGMPGLQPRVERIGRFRFAAKLADRFRDRRVFLVGDAAHRVTPRGGTGMNTAIADGFDLGWKLGWVLSGWCAPALLDRYETERMPVGARVVARSARPDGSSRSVAEGIADEIGDRIAHAWVADGVSTLDLLGGGLTLITGPDSAWPRPVTAGPLPVAAHRVGQHVAVALGIEPSGALLVRPDGRVVARWPAMDGFQDRAVRIAVDTLVGREPQPAG